jgi:hypothetical protein
VSTLDTPARRRAHPTKFQRSANKSGYRGVFRHGSGWRAMYGVNGKLQHIGYFPSLELACEAYQIATAQRDAAKLARAKANAERRIAAIARTGTKEEIARSVVDLIRLSMACSREPVAKDDAQQRYDYAVQVISGSISIGKGSQSATDTNAAADAAVPVAQRSNVGERMIAR